MNAVTQNMLLCGEIRGNIDHGIGNTESFIAISHGHIENMT